jgi:hypothetical protein
MEGPVGVAPEPVEQMTEHFRPYLRVEYHFLRTVCALTLEQRTRIARAAQREYKDAVAQYLQLRRPQGFRRAGQAPQALPDPRTSIRAALARAAEPHLNPEQAARYRQEIALRAEARKQMVIRCFVLRLDQELILSAEQRARITERLTSAWDKTWFLSDEMLLEIDRYMSRIPAHLFLSVLNDDQTKVWNFSFQGRSVPEASISLFPSIPVDFPEDAELTEARAAEGKDTKGPS